MAGIYAEEMVTALTALWAANATLTAKVPGGLWLEAAPDTADATGYAIVTVEPETAKVLANRAWVQFVTFTIGVYSEKAMDDGDRATVVTAVNRVFCDPSVSLTMTSGNESCGAACPANAKVNLAENRRNGLDVLQTEQTFKIMIQGVF